MILRPLRTLALGLALLAPLTLAASAADEFSADQQRAIEKIVREYLVGHPEVLMEALQAAEEKMNAEQEGRSKAALAERRKEIFEDPADPVGGNPKGDVTIVEFFDYRCPYCKQVHPSIVELIGSDKQVRFVYKEFPVLGKDSVFAGRAALAAARQGRYERFHDALMGLKGQLGEETVLKTAAGVGLDVDRLNADMAAPEIDRALKANIKLAEALEIHGTPGFVIGDEIVPGAVSLETLKQLIDAARKSK
jgi:protein-disulfide isomerase